MFAEFLDRHPLRELLLPRLSPLYPPASDREAWGAVPEAYRREIGEMARAYRDQPYPPRPATGFLAFTRTGSRQADEAPYFFRRRKLCVSALACCLEEDAGLDPVIDGVWCLCEETSWVISAHNVNPVPGAPESGAAPLPDAENPYIDLFSAQTGMILALTGQLLAPRLDGVSPLLRRRISREIEGRLLTPFMTRDDFWWMGVLRQDLNNWTPWIVSSILLCACALELEAGRLAALTDRACRILDRWLRTVPPDGGCDEGAGYWNMAGGALLDCLELLEKITGGRMVFWGEEKIRRIMDFPRKMEIGGGWFVNFADCDARPLLSGERLQLAGEKTGDPALAALGVRLRGSLRSQLDDVPHFSRLLSLLFHPAAAAAEPEERKDVWLPDLQVRVLSRGGMTLCCKGGSNGENHNHNDVGSFMLYVDGEPEIVDAGNAVYTARTFSESRYALWHVRSAYHNVPLIGDEEQRPGGAFAARDVRPLPEGLALDLAGAYAKTAGLESARRELRLTEEGLSLRDDLVLAAPRAVTWVLMLRHAPRRQGNEIAAGRIVLALPAGFQARAEEIPIEDQRMKKSFPGSLWRLLIAPERESARVSLRLMIGRKKDDA